MLLGAEQNREPEQHLDSVNRSNINTPNTTNHSNQKHQVKCINSRNCKSSLKLKLVKTKYLNSTTLKLDHISCCIRKLNLKLKTRELKENNNVTLPPSILWYCSFSAQLLVVQFITPKSTSSSSIKLELKHLIYCL